MHTIACAHEVAGKLRKERDPFAGQGVWEGINLNGMRYSHTLTYLSSYIYILIERGENLAWNNL